MRRLDRYILKQLFVPFLIGLLTFTIIMLGDAARQLGAALSGANASLPLIARFLFYHAPHCLSWSMPVGTVLGVAMTVALLAANGELTAMRAGGASFQRICRGIVLAGIVASGLAFAVGEYIVPPASRKARAAAEEIFYAQPIAREEYNVFFKDLENRIFYIRHLNAENNRLEEIVIWSRDDNNRLVEIATARWAEMRDNIWYLREGSAVKLDEYGRPAAGVERFGEREVRLWAALQNYYASKDTYLELSARDMGEMIAAMGISGRATHREEVQRHFKFSIPLACLVFALFAAPITFRTARYGSFTGVIVAIVVVFLYNGVRSWTLAFGLSGALDPLLAGWIPTLLFGFLGLVLFRPVR